MIIQRISRTVAFAAIGSLGLCSIASAEPLKAEVIHWWTSAGESIAIKKFADAFNAAGGEWVDSAVAGGSAARQAAISRMVAGDPPAASQFNTSREFEDLIDKGLLVDLEKHAIAGKWREVMPQALVDVSVRNGKFYALPVNIHGLNWVYYNKKVLAEAGAKEPTGWGDDMFEALDKVKASGKIALAISGRASYERLLFHSVMLWTGGTELWRAAYERREKSALMGDKIRQAFKTYGRLRAYVDEGTPGRAWNIATSMVISGKAAVTVVGDWAKGEFSAAGMTPGKEYECLIPGGIMSIAGDVFVFPKLADAASAKAQDLLVETMIAKKAQAAFNIHKGSVPSRIDVDKSGFDACAQKAMTALQKQETRVPRMTMFVTSDVGGEVADVISEFFNDPSMSVDDVMERHAELILGAR